MYGPSEWPSPAKINFFLHITGRRKDGYHNLQTAFQFLDLADTLIFERLNGEEIERAYDLPDISKQSDLIVRAAHLLQSTYAVRQGVRIQLHKNIPIGGGLGGASSNAATTLIALNNIWELHLSRAQLSGLAAGLGADVPIFVHAHAAWAEGIGEQLTTIELPQRWYLVVNPCVQVSTAELFTDPQLTRDHPQIKICAPEPGQLGNVFEPLVRRHFPPIDAAFRWLEQYAKPFLTGTGACVVAAFDQRAQAQALADRCPQQFEPHVARGYNQSQLAQYMD